MKTIDNLELKVKTTNLDFPFDRKLFEARDVAALAQQLIGVESQEHFLTFLLNTRNQVIGYSVVAIGGLTACVVDLRVVFRSAVLVGSSSILLAHNHPSQYLEPSTEDLALTKRVKGAADLLGITLLDHLIVSQSAHYSLRSTNPRLFE
jgi:DNA repair protein RadC